jgi:hypothetical protein
MRALLQNTRYGLIIAGWGYHTWRLYEVLAAGMVPVIVMDDWVMPFSEFLDWKRFAVVVPESRLADLPEILRDISPAQADALQANAILAYEEIFADRSLHVRAAIDHMVERVAPYRNVAPNN